MHKNNRNNKTEELYDKNWKKKNNVEIKEYTLVCILCLKNLRPLSKSEWSKCMMYGKQNLPLMTFK